MDPIKIPNPAQLAADMPAAAKQDLLEWSPYHDVAGYLGLIVTREFPLQNILKLNAEIEITDDDPLNEYFLLRQLNLF